MQQAGSWKNRRTGYMLAAYCLGIVMLLLLLTAATYTWFSLSRAPRVNDMYLTVSAPAGLEISLAYDAENEDWGQNLSFSDMVKEMTPLRPCTWSDADSCFYAALYGADGRPTGRWTRLTDAENANTTGPSGYYTKGSFYARSDTAVAVSLGKAEALEDGTLSTGTYLIGTPVWNEQTVLHDNGGGGAEYAVRIGLRVTPLNEQGEEIDRPTFYIYEPNSDGHLDGPTGYQETGSMDGTQTLVPRERLITQTTSLWEEVYPVQRAATLRRMGEFTSDTKLFALEAGGLERIDLYIWLEGQDEDCSHLLSTDCQILANLQLTGDYDVQSGLIPIEEK